MKISRHSAGKIATEFKMTLEWMSSLGIKTTAARVQAYEIAINEWAALPPSTDQNARHVLSPAAQRAIFESDQFIDVYRTFHNIPSDDLSGIIDKLTKAVNGPVDVVDETDTSNEARNFLFEAVVAAKFHCSNHGRRAILDAAGDTGLTYLSRRIFVECKRLRSFKKLERRLRDACNQLTDALNGDNTRGHGGLVAVEVSNILAADDEVLHDTSLCRRSVEYMDQFIVENSKVWQHIYLEKDHRIFGAIFRLSRFVQSEYDGLWVIATEWAINPRHLLGASESLYLKRLAKSLERVTQNRIV